MFANLHFASLKKVAHHHPLSHPQHQTKQINKLTQDNSLVWQKSLIYNYINVNYVLII